MARAAGFNLFDDGKLPESLSLKEKLHIVQKATNDILHDDVIAKNL